MYYSVDYINFNIGKDMGTGRKELSFNACLAL
jgi:hypothetical protein